ncbi:hypothetical protein LSH36_63g04036, partial [Paralvinella palmiformis]
MVLTTNGHPQPCLVFSQHQDGRQGIIIADGINIPVTTTEFFSYVWHANTSRMLLCMGS